MWGLWSETELIRARVLLHGAERAPVRPSKRSTDPSPGSLHERLSIIAESAGCSFEKILALSIVSLMAMLFLAGLALTSNLMLLLLAPLPPACAMLALKRASLCRTEAFECDYPAFLLSLSSAVRTGLDPVTAFCRSEILFTEDSILRKELEKSREAIERGAGEEDVIRGFAASIAHPDLDLFRTAFILSRKQGSSLSPCLQRLVKVTRQRQSFRRKTASAVALQKISALGIAGCALATGAMQYGTNPAAFHQTLAHPLGSRALLLGAFCMVSGLCWMLYMTRRRL